MEAIDKNMSLTDIVIVVLVGVIICLILLKLFIVLSTFDCTSNTCLIGKVALVTGGNSGIGLETCFILASRGCKVIIGDVKNSESNVAKIIADTGNPNIYWKHVDLASLASVRRFADEILKTETKLDLLINNAGIGISGELTKDGLCEIMQVNYFGHFLLTHLLIDLLKKSKKSRVIGVSSIMAFVHTLTSPENVAAQPHSFLKLFRDTLPYANAKVAVLISMRLMANKMKEHGIKCYTVHTGATYTPLFPNAIEKMNVNKIIAQLYLACVRIIIFFLGKTVRQAAYTIIQCAISKEAEDLSGKYFWNGKVFWDPPIVYDEKLCLGIWKESERLVQLKDSEKI